MHEILQKIAYESARYENLTGKTPNAVIIGTDHSEWFARQIVEFGVYSVDASKPILSGVINGLRIIPCKEFPNAFSVVHCEGFTPSSVNNSVKDFIYEN